MSALPNPLPILFKGGQRVAPPKTVRLTFNGENPKHAGVVRLSPDLPVATFYELLTEGPYTLVIRPTDRKQQGKNIYKAWQAKSGRSTMFSGKILSSEYVGLYRAHVDSYGRIVVDLRKKISRDGEEE